MGGHRPRSPPRSVLLPPLRHSTAGTTAATLCGVSRRLYSFLVHHLDDGSPYVLLLPRGQQEAISGDADVNVVARSSVCETGGGRRPDGGAVGTVAASEDAKDFLKLSPNPKVQTRQAKDNDMIW